MGNPIFKLSTKQSMMIPLLKSCTSPDTGQGRAMLALLINSAVWGLSWIPFKALGASGIHPLWATCLMFGLASVVMVVYNNGLVQHFRNYPSLWILAAAAGLTNACFNSAVALGNVVRVMLLFYVMPLWAALLARIILKEPITSMVVIEMLLGLTGALLVVYQPSAGMPIPQNFSEWLALAGGFLFALNNVFLKKLHNIPASYCSMSMVFSASFVSGVCAALLSVFGIISIPAFDNTHALLTIAMWSGLFLMGNSCLQYGASRLAPNLTAILMLTEVLIGAGSAWLLSASHIRPQDIFGGVFIIAAGLVRTVMVKKQAI
jgi:drug/metabolite transporter (DMT)-like permease